MAVQGENGWVDKDGDGQGDKRLKHVDLANIAVGDGKVIAYSNYVLHFIVEVQIYGYSPRALRLLCDC